MSVDKAGEIIRRAMADRSVYDAMVARENEVWGKILPDREQCEPEKTFDLVVAQTRLHHILFLEHASVSLM